MFKDQIYQVNNDIKRTKRAIIGIGCSFVQGSGAIPDEIYANYKWEKLEIGDTRVTWKLTDADITQLLKQYTDVGINHPGKQPNFIFNEYNNSFLNVLCSKYLNGEYAAINLGIAGSGNRAAIKELHYYPDILWNEVEEFIVIYCPSGLERFDFISDLDHDPNNHNRWISMWPNILPHKSLCSDLWNGYRNCLYSNKFEVLEQIANIQELLLWCNYKNARLIITPAFNRNYSKDYFTSSMNQSIFRNDVDPATITKAWRNKDPNTNLMLKMWPWEKMFEPDGCPSFIDLTMKQEFPDTWKDNEHFYNYKGLGTPNGWVTPCAHPSARAHDLFAKYLYEHIVGNI